MLEPQRTPESWQRALAILVVRVLRSQNALEFALSAYGLFWGWAYAFAKISATSPLDGFASAIGGHKLIGIPIAFFGGIGILALLSDWRKGRAYTSLLGAMAWGTIGWAYFAAVPPRVPAYVTFWFFTIAELIIFIRVWHGFDRLPIQDS